MLLMDLMLTSCVKDGTFKKSMKQNHLLELTLETWEDFIDDKVSLTFSLINRFYDEYYPDSTLVTRNELDISNERLFEKIKPIIVTMYRKAREISSDAKHKIDFIQLEIDTLCKVGTLKEKNETK